MHKNQLRRTVGRKRWIVASIVSAAILAVLAWKTGVRLDSVRLRIANAHWGILVATMAGSALWHMFVGADKWWRILRGLGADVGYWRVFRVRLGSDPLRFALPFKSGELVNALYFGQRGMGFSRAAGSIAFDKALNFFGTVFWLYVGLAVIAATPSAGYLSVHTAVGAAVLVLLWVPAARHIPARMAGLLHPKLGRVASEVLSAFEEFSPWQKIGYLLYGIVFQLRPLAVCALLFIAFHPEHLPSIQEFLAYGSIVVLMSNIPLTVAGIGPRETTLALLFVDFADQASLFSIGLMMSFSIHVIPAIVGIPLMIPLIRDLAVKTPETQ
jgi:hypothetical protein